MLLNCNVYSHNNSKLLFRIVTKLLWFKLRKLPQSLHNYWHKLFLKIVYLLFSFFATEIGMFYHFFNQISRKIFIQQLAYFLINPKKMYRQYLFSSKLKKNCKLRALSLLGILNNRCPCFPFSC